MSNAHNKALKSNQIAHGIKQEFEINGRIVVGKPMASSIAKTPREMSGIEQRIAKAIPEECFVVEKVL